MSGCKCINSARRALLNTTARGHLLLNVATLIDAIEDIVYVTQDGR